MRVASQGEAVPGHGRCLPRARDRAERRRLRRGHAPAEQRRDGSAEEERGGLHEGQGPLAESRRLRERPAACRPGTGRRGRRGPQGTQRDPGRPGHGPRLRRGHPRRVTSLQSESDARVQRDLEPRHGLVLPDGDRDLLRDDDRRIVSVDWTNTTGPEGEAIVMMRNDPLGCATGQFQVRTYRHPIPAGRFASSRASPTTSPSTSSSRSTRRLRWGACPRRPSVPPEPRADAVPRGVGAPALARGRRAAGRDPGHGRPPRAPARRHARAAYRRRGAARPRREPRSRSSRRTAAASRPSTGRDSSSATRSST